MEIQCLNGKVFVEKILFDSTRTTPDGKKIESSLKESPVVGLTVESFGNIIAYVKYDIPIPAHENIPMSLVYQFFPHKQPQEILTKQSEKIKEKELNKKMKELTKYMKSFRIGIFTSCFGSRKKLMDLEQKKLDFIKEVELILPKDIKNSNMLNFIASLTRTDKAVLNIYENSHNVVSILYDHFLGGLKRLNSQLKPK